MIACIRLLLIAATAFTLVLSASQPLSPKKQARNEYKHRRSNSAYSLLGQTCDSSLDIPARNLKRAKTRQSSESSDSEALVDDPSLAYTGNMRSEPLMNALVLLASLPAVLIHLTLSYAQISRINPELLASFPLYDCKAAMFMVPGDLGVEIPVKDFKTCLLEYKDLACSKREIEKFCTKILPIEGFVDFAVCPEYKVFITCNLIVTVWTNSGTTSTFNHPYSDAPLKILAMSSKGRVLLLNKMEPGWFVLCNLKTGKFGEFGLQEAREEFLYPCVAMNSNGTLLSIGFYKSGLEVSKILESEQGEITVEAIAKVAEPMPEELTKKPIAEHCGLLHGCNSLHFIGDSMLSVESHGHVVLFTVDADQKQLTRLPNSFSLPPRCCDALACAKLRRYSPLTNTLLMVNLDNSQASRILRMPLFNDIEALVVGLPHACQYNDGRPLKINALGSHCVVYRNKIREEVYIYELMATDREIMDCLSEYVEYQRGKTEELNRAHDIVLSSRL